jgi:CheY-like chemotaxis protein
VNLVSNAIKFTEKGYVKIQVSLEDKNDMFNNLHFVVSDTGIGIPENKLDQLFQPFTQLDGSYTRKYGGTGLGLVIAKSYIDLMEGNIHVESQLGKGTKFIFNLKLKEVDELTEDAKKNISNEGYTDISDTVRQALYKLSDKRKKFKILIAEDNIVNQKVVSKMLVDFGYKCETVNNGEEAVHAVNEGNYDAVLMDIQMPKMDGLAATRHIRNIRNGQKDIPIIAITAHALVGDKEKCFEAGMNEYLSKPVFSEILIGKLDSILNLQLEENEEIISENSNHDNIFNFDQLDKVSLSDEEFQKELLTTYFIDIESRIQKLGEFYSSNNIEKLIKEAHTIKGSSFSVGAVKLAEEALSIEISGKNNDLNSVGGKIKNIKTALDETRDIVKHIVKDAKALD